MNISGKKLEALEALSRFRHFGRAAAHLGVSQPSLSRHIQELETQLGERLFDRHTRVVSLTPMGQEILTYAKQLAAFQARAQQRFNSRRAGKSGHVAIAALPSLIGQIIAPVLREMRRAYPDLAIEVLDRPSRQIRETVLLEQADIGLDSPVDDHFDELVAEKLTIDALCVVVHKDHPLAARTSVQVQDLLGVDLIGSTDGTSLRHLTNQSFSKQDLTFRPVYELNQVVSVLGLVTSELGAAILPVSAGCILPEKCRCLALDGAAERVTWMFRKEHLPMDPAIARVMASLRKHAKAKLP